MFKNLKTMCIALLLGAFGGIAQAQLSDVTQPGDTIVATSDNSPGSEGVTNAIDNADTKYLNFDISNTGFTVTPSVGLTVVSGISLRSANDAVERDPASYTLEGSYDGVNFTEISAGDVPAFADRFTTQYFFFENSTPYLSYRLVFPTVADEGAANSMQIAEVELLGAQAPGDVTQPGDAIVATSDNSPGSEGVTNAIDNADTKYLNFDKVNTGFTVTPSVGLTVVNGVTLRSANDAVERDPASFTLEGSYDGVNFTEISAGDVPAFADRFTTQYFFFENSTPYLSYRLVFPTVADEGAANSMQIAEVELLGSQAPGDVTQPGDAIVATSDNSPGSEGVTNVIDNADTKYLNFDKVNTGFTVTPSVGLTIVSGLTLRSANDAVERDPASYVLEGSYDGVNFTQISSGDVSAFADRFTTQYFFFDNATAYLSYRLVFPTVSDEGAANSMQIAEVQLLGTQLPGDVTQPGDSIVASSDNSPGSEGVTNAIDNADTKYLNFDKVNTGFTVTPSVGLSQIIGLSLKSANDAVERDPASYVLEGSYDGVNFTEVASGDVPAFADRFTTQYFFFDNSTPYLTYRVTFPTVADEGAANSMQIAEVELFPQPGGSCADFSSVSEGLISQQPTDTPVLAGATASISVVPSGPWDVQWLKQGPGDSSFVLVDGATSATLEVKDVTADMDGTIYQARVSNSQCDAQYSQQVTLSIFTPSDTTSVGFTFRGGGANGAPTSMTPTDIAGFHPQAYWNNVEGGSGDTGGGVWNDESGAADAEAVDSNNSGTEVGIEFTTGGTWGAGSRTASATGRMLNGLVRTNDDSLEDGTTELVVYGLPAGSHSLIIYTVQVPLEFWDLDIEVEDANGAQRRYMRPQNSDEYNPSPNYVLVTAEDADARSVGNMVVFSGLTPSNGEITIRYAAPSGNDQGPGINGLQVLLNKEFVPPPVINVQPISTNGVDGSPLELSVDASGADSIQWFKNGQPIPGATGATLRLGRLSAGDAAAYSVTASNDGGSVTSKAAVVDVLPNKDITNGLVSYFPFDGNANNAAGAANGETKNGAGFGSGQIGQALELDGSDDWVFVPNYPKPSKAMTVSTWVLPDGIDWGPVVRNWVTELGDGRFG
ncbi:MAG: hypothetical protein O2964_04600, partial [Verrucomicrobia bacterium]|nr:hypothetical protein [Verrucomicrobiota bacterium]